MSNQKPTIDRYNGMGVIEGTEVRGGTASLPAAPKPVISLVAQISTQTVKVSSNKTAKK